MLVQILGFKQGNFKQLDSIDQILDHGTGGIKFGLHPVDFVEQELLFELPLFVSHGGVRLLFLSKGSATCRKLKTVTQLTPSWLAIQITNKYKYHHQSKHR